MHLILLSYALAWVGGALYAASLARYRRGSKTLPARRAERLLGAAASAATGLSWALLTAALVARAIGAGHWPLTNRFEFALCFTWAILGLYLLLEWRTRERRAGAFVIGIALLVMTFAMLSPAEEKEIHPLLPALRSIWLQVHGVTAAIGYGACGVAAGLAIAQLAGAEPHAIERQTERVIGWGFPFLSAALLSGAFWAQEAWGRYWGWDPKETWALITWLWYVLLLHIWGFRSWRGRRLAWLTIAGFGVVCFAFVGLPWLLRMVRMSSLHTF